MSFRRSGRKKDLIWQFFKEKSGKAEGKPGCRATCKKCNLEMQGLVERMKKHWEKCKNVNNEDIDTIDTYSDSSFSSTLSQSQSVLTVSIFLFYYLLIRTAGLLVDIRK